jgi:hypothetical protein
MNDRLSPCAADALSQVRQIAIDGQKVGIVRLNESISEVMAMNLSADADIQAALLQRIEQHNYIPPSAGEVFAKSLMAEFYADRMKQRMKTALKNYSAIDHD